jgi:hypothetical protein
MKLMVRREYGSRRTLTTIITITAIIESAKLWLLLIATITITIITR